MKYHNSFDSRIRDFDVDVIELLLDSIVERLKKPNLLKLEISFADSTGDDFRLGKLREVVEQKQRKGVKVRNVSLNAVKSSSINSDHKVIILEVSNEYRNIRLTVGSEGSQPYVDWADTTFRSLQAQIENTFLASQPKALEPSIKKKPDWVKWTGIGTFILIAIAIITLIVMLVSS